LSVFFLGFFVDVVAQLAGTNMLKTAEEMAAAKLLAQQQQQQQQQQGTPQRTSMFSWLPHGGIRALSSKLSNPQLGNPGAVPTSPPPQQPQQQQQQPQQPQPQPMTKSADLAALNVTARKGNSAEGTNVVPVNPSQAHVGPAMESTHHTATSDTTPAVYATPSPSRIVPKMEVLTTPMKASLLLRESLV
jgi:hypothetical protein